jgi:hypothetical protein
MSAPLQAMRNQFNSLLSGQGWGTLCRISRLSGTADTRGHMSGSFVTLQSGARIWIQALAGRSSIDTKNLNAETTHLAFQKYSGTAMRPKDRVLPSGETYSYDVIRAHVFESHRMAELKQDLRT